MFAGEKDRWSTPHSFYQYQHDFAKNNRRAYTVDVSIVVEVMGTTAVVWRVLVLVCTSVVIDFVVLVAVVTDVRARVL